MNDSVNKRKRNAFCKCAFEWQIFIAEVRHYAAYDANELSLKGTTLKSEWENCETKSEFQRQSSEVTEKQKLDKNHWIEIKKLFFCMQLNWKRNFSIVKSLKLKRFYLRLTRERKIFKWSPNTRRKVRRMKLKNVCSPLPVYSLFETSSRIIVK